MPLSQFHSRFSRMNAAFNEIQAHGLEDAAQLELKGAELLETLRAQYRQREPLFDFADDVQLTQQLTRLYSQQLTSVETLIRTTADQLAIRINELKQELSDTVTRLFAMEYHYQMTERTVSDEEAPADCHRQRVDDFVSNVLPGAMDLGSRAIETAMMDSYETLLRTETQVLTQDFARDSKEVCDQLNATLNSILLYREENSSTVAQRINHLNKLIKKLKQLREDLQRMA